MYGLVNKAIKDLVVNNHGQENWDLICEEVGHEEADFISMSPYPDKLTYDLVGAASKVLNTDANSILEAFGEYWILFTAEQGYGDLLDLSGNSFTEFLGNLDMLHLRINNMMPELKAPLFSTRNETSNSVELVYNSHRAGLVPMLYGLIRGLGKRFDLVVLDIQQLEEDKSVNGLVFKISW
ncbi:MAG: heme NO-binding domain-containing protein [Crocinitomicaceae bacterium]|jgi:hypothetical protein|tara:strand:- start:3431 stop:3973 length:543 start_codon:yes stop_codon:yes gene_type:complete